MTKRKPMKRERAYVVVIDRPGALIYRRREDARKQARFCWWSLGISAAYVQPVDIIPAKGRKG